MSANQIIIPIAVLALVAWIVFLIVRTKRINAARKQREHRANTPDTGHDKGAIARSASHGLGSGSDPL